MFASFIAGAIVRPIFCHTWEDKGDDYTCYSTGVGGIVFGLIIIVLFAYPHIMFIIEVKKGILTKETYPREEFSCCCVANGAAANTDAMARLSTVGPAPAGSIVANESILPDGTKQIEKIVTAPDGSKPIPIFNETVTDKV